MTRSPKPRKGRAWLLAARPQTLPASIAPVLVGLALGYADRDGHLDPAMAAVCLLFALLMQIASNYINDLYDYLKGSDGEDRQGPKRAVAEGWISPRAMRWGIGIVLFAACVVGSLALLQGGWVMLWVGIGCVLGAYLYTAGPYPLAYHGGGDVLVIAFFGLVPACGTYYLQTATLTHDALLAGTLCGLVADALLVVNNYRDRAQDKRSGKRTLVVRFGARFGAYFYLLLGLAACWFCLVFAVNGRVYAALLPQLFLLWHIYNWKALIQGNNLNQVLARTGKGILLYALLLAAGFIF
jgi:1,4-dihydroxy-2-naphthoate octaprenyltransferase